eukprot:scaffold5888_cov118-Isochrysis_galbana.AAC.2
MTRRADTAGERTVVGWSAHLIDKVPVGEDGVGLRQVDRDEVDDALKRRAKPSAGLRVCVHSQNAHLKLVLAIVLHEAHVVGARLGHAGSARARWRQKKSARGPPQRWGAEP